jgi:type II secretory pathway pseudopilin PulG
MKLSKLWKKVRTMCGFTPHHFCIKSGAGFSIIEMIIVVGIAVMVVYMVSNAFLNFLDQQRLNAAVENTITLIQKAREQTLASKNNLLYGIHFDTNAGTAPNQNQIVFFQGNDYTITNHRLETLPINSPTIIDSVNIYPLNVTGLNDAGHGVSNIIFKRLTGETAIATTTASGFATTSLSSFSKSFIVFKSLRSGQQRSLIISPSGNVQVSVMPPAIGAWAFNEGSGPDASDSTGDGNKGTLVSGPTWTTGQTGYGNALSFDGSNDRVEVSNSYKPFITQNGGTVSLWYYRPTSPAISGAPISMPEGTGTAQYSALGNTWQIEFYSTTPCNYTYGGIAFVSDDTDGHHYDCAAAPSTVDWHYIALTWEKQPSGLIRKKMYIDGSLKTLKSSDKPSCPCDYIDRPVFIWVPINDPTKNIVIGGDYNDNNYTVLAAPFNSKIDNVRIYGVPLTPDQILVDKATPI